MSFERGPNEPPNDPTKATHVRQGRIVKGGVMVRTLIVSLLLLILAFFLIAAIW